MKRLLCFLSMGLITVGCAGVEADLEKASYLLGRGGVANGEKAASILEPYISSGSLSGEEALEAARLYAGAKMAQAGFDSITISAGIVFPGDDSMIKVLSASLSSGSEAALLNQARQALDNAISSEDYTSLPATKDRIKRGLQFQRALVDLLESLRVLVGASGFNEAAFNAGSCEDALETLADLNDGVQAAIDSRNRLRNADGVGLSNENALVSALNQVIQGINPSESGEIANASELQALCEYLQQQNN